MKLHLRETGNWPLMELQPLSSWQQVLTGRLVLQGVTHRKQLPAKLSGHVTQLRKDRDADGKPV